MKKHIFEDLIKHHEFPHTNQHGFSVYHENYKNSGLKNLLRFEWIIIGLMFLGGLYIVTQNIWQAILFGVGFLIVVHFVYKLIKKIS